MKEFKAWDKHFSKAELQYFRDTSPYFTSTYDYVMSRHSWMYSQYRQSWDQETIQEAAYKREDAREWQKFRVALKGLTTEAKLAALEIYWEIHVQHSNSISISRINHCRVDNYIGALIRGGQLTTDYKIKPIPKVRLHSRPEDKDKE